MYQRLSFNILLGVLAFVSFSITASATASLDKNYSPLSHTYTHDLLKSVSKFHASFDDVPFGVSPFIKGLQINQGSEGNITVDALFPLPFIVLNIGADLKPKLEEDFGFGGNLLREIPRGNVILGHIYKYPFYVRAGYDYIPFGRHFSNAITPHRMVTKSMMEDKWIVFSGGGAYRGSQGEFQGSMSFAGEVKSTNRALGCVNSQYEHMQPYLGIERSLVGGGIGITDEWDVLFNCYSHINFSKSYNFLFEYVYNTHVFLSADCRKQALAHALHIEGSKHFPQVAIMRWQSLPTAIGGFECGSKLLRESPVTISNLFIAGKLEFWKKRLTLLGGARLNFANGFQPFYRVGLSL